MPILPPSNFFPPAESANRDGLLGVGGELTPEWLLDAYRHGIFPWPMVDFSEMLWWSPDPRAILELDQFRLSRRDTRTIANGRYQVTSDRDFAGVLAGCASAGDRETKGTWLTPQMQTAYLELHRLGHAHSVEAWCDGRLVGGIYGVALGGYFSGESMFYRERDASKVALAKLIEHLRCHGYVLMDIQQWTPHTGRLGASEIPRRVFLERLAAALERNIQFGAVAEQSP